MSVYNLEDQTALKYYKKHREYLLNISDKEHIKTYFLVGEKINKKRQQFSLVMTELLCTENCEVINYLNEKLNGKLEKRRIQNLDLVEQTNGGNITYNITQVIKEEATWENETLW